MTEAVGPRTTGPSVASATGSTTPDCSTRPWPTGPGAPSSPSRTSNERLEFLGDAVLGLVVAEYAFRNHPELSDGVMSKVRASVVNARVLAEVALELGSPSTSDWARARTSRGAGPRSRSWPTPPRPSSAPSTSTGAWPRPSGSSSPCSRAGSPWRLGEPGESDHKSRLQELTVRLGRGVPHYEVEGSGPDHARRYLATVYVAGQRLGTGEGRSKKDAEQIAAQVACGSLEVERGGGNA